MSKWEKVKWAEVVEIKNGKNQKKVEDNTGKYPIYGSGGIMGYANDYLCDENSVVIGRKGSINKPIFVTEKFWNVDTAFGLKAKGDVLDSKYLYYFCVNFNFESLNTTVTIPSLTKSNLLNIEMCLPPIETQKQIAKTLDTAAELLAMRKQQLAELDSLIKSVFYEMFGDPFENPREWEVCRLSDLAVVTMGQSPNGTSYNEEGIGVPLLNGPTEFGDRHPVEKQWTTQPTKMCQKDDILFCVRGATAGKMNIADKEYCIGRGLAAIRPKFKDSHGFIYLYLLMMNKYLQSTSNGSTFINISKDQLNNLPYLKLDQVTQSNFSDIYYKIEEQKALVKKAIEETQTLFDSLMAEYFED